MNAICVNAAGQLFRRRFHSSRVMIQEYSQIYSRISARAWLDIKAGSFWTRGVTTFFDERVKHMNSTCNQNKSTQSIFEEHENEKKRKY